MLPRTVSVTCAISILVLAVVVPRRCLSAQGLDLRQGQEIRVQTHDGKWLKQPRYFCGQFNGLVYVVADECELNINWVVTDQRNIAYFRYGGAHYDPGTDAISGVIVGGDSVVLPLSEIAATNVEYISQGLHTTSTLTPDIVRRRLSSAVSYPVVTSLPLDSVRRIKVRRETRIERGIGCAVGAIVGVRIATKGITHQEDDWFGIGETGEKIFRGTLGLVVGAAAGYMLGYTVAPKWKTIKLDPANVTVVPYLENGAALSLSLHF